jgi:hypothetical protein
VETGEVGAPSVARTWTNGPRRDGAASCALQSEEDGAQEGEKEAKWSHARWHLTPEQRGKGEGGGGLALHDAMRREEEVGPGVAHARARGGAWRRQRPISAEVGGGQGDRGGRTVVGVLCGTRPWAGPGRRKKGEQAQGERKEMDPTPNE